MKNNQYKELTHQAMDFALRNGCKDCRIGFYKSNNSSYDMRDLKMEQLSQAFESRMQIELFVDGRYGSFSTNRMDKNEIETLIKNGITAVKFLEQDHCRQLPSPDLYYKGEDKDLQQFDATLFDISPETKKDILYQNIDEISNASNKIISVSGIYSDGSDSGYMITSNGFEGDKTTTWYSLGVEVSLKGVGDARPEEGWYESALFNSDLKKSGIGKIALERGLRKLKQKKIATGKYTMIVENIVTSRLLSPMLSAMNGNALQQNNSFLLNKLDQKVASELLTIIDEPHIPKSFGARLFDEEGITTKRRPIFENGVLKTYYIDVYNALKMNVSPTISSPSQLEMKKGNRDLEAIIKSQNRAILITGFNGGNCNPTTGDFSYGIEGLLIEKGAITQPISEMNITGNMLELWNSLIEVGNDPKINSSRWIPTLVFDSVSFSGL